MNARAAGIVSVVIHFLLGFAFVHAGAAAWMWERVERDVPWRTGPTALGVLTYFAIYWGAWFIIRETLRLLSSRESLRERGTSESNARHAPRLFGRSGSLGMTGTTVAAIRALVASYILVVIQVLMPSMWLPVALAGLLIAMLIDACLVRESLGRTITAWAWSGAGMALATLLIHPYFIGLPPFVVRLAVVMTLWDWAGARVGVTPRLARFVPSLYPASGSIPPHAEVARR